MMNSSKLQISKLKSQLQTQTELTQTKERSQAEIIQSYASRISQL